MKSLITLTLTFIVIAATSTALAADVNKDLDSLGSNDAIIKKAKALNPKNEVRIVQNRAVDRTLRFELGINYGGVAGGDPYMDTQSMGGNLDFHFTPRWSIGGRYQKHFNSLTSEGKRLYDEADAAIKAKNPNYSIPDMDAPQDTMMAVINWYPIYGKLNLFNAGIAQFDIYAIAGAGQVRLTSGNAPTYTAGGGIGIWLAQHISGRLEIRYQTYEDQVYTGVRRVNLTVATAGIGILL
jgi:outer membrane immunogenic protein